MFDNTYTHCLCNGDPRFSAAHTQLVQAMENLDTLQPTWGYA